MLLSIGMSNTSQEFTALARLAREEGAISTHVTLVDGAQGNQDAHDWAAPESRFDPKLPSAWDVVQRRLRAQDVSAAQVQVVWLKHARRGPAKLGVFPAHAQRLAEDLRAVLAELRKTFPNLRLVYLSSRIYAGHSRGGGNPEPFAYESGFAARWMIEEQVREAKADGPAVLWGPYLWADGSKPRKDGLRYVAADFAADGVHPSPAGREKIARELLKFFKSDPSAAGWFAPQADR